MAYEDYIPLTDYLAEAIGELKETIAKENGGTMPLADTGGSGGACGSTCTGSCTTGCYGSCKGGCSGSCEGCSGTCSGSCTNQCQSCKSSCTGSCSGGCSNTCTGGCTNSCTSTCLLCQTRCEGTGQTVATYRNTNAFDWDTPIVSNGIFRMTATEWNRLCQYINQAGPYCGSGRFSYTLATSNSYFTHQMFNQVNTAINNLSNANTGISSNKSTNDKIYASEIQKLKTEYNGARIINSQCCELKQCAVGNSETCVQRSPAPCSQT